MQFIAYVTFLSDSSFCKLYLADESGTFKPCLNIPASLKTKVKKTEGELPVWIVPNDCLQDVFRYNDIYTFRSPDGAKGNIRYLNERPVSWYQFKDAEQKPHFCFNIDEGRQFFMDWLAAGVPTMYRYTTNSKSTSYKDSFSSKDDAPPLIFDSVIVMGYTFTKVYDISKEDIRRIAEFCAGSETGRLLQYYLQGISASNEEVKQAALRIHKAEREINSIVETHKEEIRALIAQNEPEKVVYDKGWIDWKVTEPASLLNDLCILEAAGKYPFHIFDAEKLYSITYSYSPKARKAGAKRACEILKTAGYQMEFKPHTKYGGC